MALSDLYFLLNIFSFEVVIELHHFSLPFPPSKYSHCPPLALFQIYGLFFFDWYLYVYIYSYI